jgi:hypothetical protein
MTRELGVYDDPHAPVLLSSGDRPLEGETLVELVSAGPPIHFFDERKLATRSSRIVARFRAVEFYGEQLPRYYPVICECERPVLNTECKSWKPKGGRSSLHRDASVALGRLPRKGDRLLPSKLFRNKLFRAEIFVVRQNRKGESLPRSQWHSRLGRLIALEAGGASRFSNPDSHSNSPPFPVTKTSPFPTTKDGKHVLSSD